MRQHMSSLFTSTITAYSMRGFLSLSRRANYIFITYSLGYLLCMRYSGASPRIFEWGGGLNRRQGGQNTPKLGKTPDFGHFILESGGVDTPGFQKCGGQDPPTPRRRRPWRYLPTSCSYRCNIARTACPPYWESCL